MRPLAHASVDQFAALGDATRARVLELLSEKSRPVHELAAAFDISRPAISRHLRVLKEAGLVKEEKQGRENLYALQRGRRGPRLEWLEANGGSRARAGAARVKTAAAKRAEPARKAGPTHAKTKAGPAEMAPKAPPAAVPQIAFDF